MVDTTPTAVVIREVSRAGPHYFVAVLLGEYDTGVGRHGT
jgi:hypothetical protein